MSLFTGHNYMHSNQTVLNIVGFSWDIEKEENKSQQLGSPMMPNW